MKWICASKAVLRFQLALICAVSCAPLMAVAKTDAEIRTAVEETIAVRHPKDTLEWWRALGPRAPKVIIQMYQGTTHIYQRMRLLQGLGAYDDPEAVQFLKQESAKTPDDVIRNAAIRAVGASQGGKEREWLAEQLEHSDPNTRMAAFEALRANSDQASKDAADKHIAHEKVDWARKKMKGEPPDLPTRLPVVASSEDRIRPDLEGRWRGVWAGPEWKLPAEVRAERVEVDFQLLDSGVMRGTLRLRERAKPVWTLENGKGKGSKIQGVWVQAKIKENKSTLLSIRVPFEGEVKSFEGEPLLQLSQANSPMVFLLRKVP